jgi:hypothetical protein
MGRVTINEDDLNNQGSDLFPKLELDDEGEIARLFCYTDNAWSEWVHNIRAPEFSGGAPVTSTGRNGRERYETTFVGQRICLGAAEVMDEKRSDPRNCPACAEAEKGVVQGLEADRRYALPVVRYACKNSHSDVVRGGAAAGGEVLIFALTSRMYKDLLKVLGQMRDLLEIPAPQEIHLRQADVIVEREKGGPMRLKWLAPKRSAALADENVRAFLRALVRDPENLPTEAQLRARCGKEPDRAYLMQDLRYAISQWRKADQFEQGGSADPLGGAEAGAGKPLAEDLDALIGDDGAAPAGAPASDDPLADAEDVHTGGIGEFAPKGAAKSANGHASADPLGDGEPDPLAEPAAARPASPAEPAKAVAARTSKSFDDILGDED